MALYIAQSLDLVYRHWTPITVVLLALITVLSLSPLPELPEFASSDKAHHFVAYAALMFPAALRRARGHLLIALGFALWSGVIELIQPFVNRYAEWLDLLANCCGLLLGMLLARLASQLLQD